MRKIKIATPVLLLTLFICFQAEAKLNVVTTTTDLAYLVRSIGGEHVSVREIIKGYEDPHYAQAKPSFLVLLSKADLFVIVGLDLEIGYVPLLLQGARNPGIMPGTDGFLDCSVFITPIEVPLGVDRTKGDVHPLGNPHYWLDPQNALLVAEGIAARLIKLMPDKKEVINSNLKKLFDSIREAEKSVADRLAPFKGKPVVSYHKTFCYFLKRFGIDAAGFIESKPGIPPTPRHVSSLINVIKTRDVLVILNEKYFDEDIAATLSEKTGVRFKSVPTSVGGAKGVDTLEALYRTIADAIAGL